MATKTDIELTKVRLALKPFILICRTGGLAYKMPDTIMDAIPDKHLEYAAEYLKSKRIIKVNNGYWEYQ